VVPRAADDPLALVTLTTLVVPCRVQGTDQGSDTSPDRDPSSLAQRLVLGWVRGCGRREEGGDVSTCG
jgi:hypothetical protein